MILAPMTENKCRSFRRAPREGLTCGQRVKHPVLVNLFVEEERVFRQCNVSANSSETTSCWGSMRTIVSSLL